MSNIPKMGHLPTPGETIQIYRFRGNERLREIQRARRKIGQLEDVSPGFRVKSEDIYGRHHAISGTITCNTHNTLW